MVRNAPLQMNPKREYPDPSNTLQNLHTLSVNVTRYFTDVNGTLLDKNDAGLVAANMAVNYPVLVMGQWDLEGGYAVGQKVCPPLGGAKYYMTFINGKGLTSQQICSTFSPANQIQSLLRIGDIVQVYTDNLQAPNYFVWIVLTSNAFPLASVMKNFSTKQDDNRLMKLFCYQINFKANFMLQLPEVWHYVNVDNLGAYKDNQITYNMFNNPMNVLPDFLTLQTEFLFNQYIGIYLYMVIGVDTMNFNFNLKMIQ